MQRTDERDAKTRIADGVSAFLHRYWKTIVIIFVALAVVVIGVFAYTQIQSSRANTSARMLETLRQDYQAWLDAEEAERDELEEAVLDAADEIIESYSGMYAASRALMIRADIHWEKEEWGEAASDYAAVAEQFKDSHLAPVALFNAAAAEEAAGKFDTALGHIDTLVERYGGEDPTPEISRALFTQGRLNENLANYELAADAYNRLADEHPQSSWTNLARNRIIALKTRGLIAE